MLPQERLNLIRETMAAFTPHYNTAMLSLLAEAGYEGPDWFITYVAYGLEPKPLTAVAYNQMFPYVALANQAQTLAGAVERGFLQEVGQGAYRLTEKGRVWMDKFYEVAGAAISDLAPLPTAKMERLASLLERVVKATEAVEKLECSQFSISRRTDPGPDAPLVVRVDQYLTDLRGFRDEAHILAWHPYAISGRSWETFSDVWQGDATTATAIFEARANRGFTEADYDASLQELVERGWIEKGNGRYQTTPVGQKIREQVETETDQIYFGGWNALNESEKAELEQLLWQLKGNLRHLALTKIWHLTSAIQGTWVPLYQEKTAPAFAEYGLNKTGYFFTLWNALTLDPEPISVANMHKRYPYSKGAHLENWFSGLVEDGFLAKGAAQEYYLTDKGRQATWAVDGVFTSALSEIEPLPTEDLTQLIALLGRVADASLEAESPPDNWCLTYNRRVHRGEDLSALVKLDQYVDDLAAYRDDAHLAAFLPQNVPAHEWEAFTLIWRGTVNTAAALAQRQSGFRGYDTAAYADALQNLVARGWLIADGDMFNVTEAGSTLRDDVEKLTDQYFFAPWAGLNNNDLGQMISLLSRLQSSLQTMALDKVAATRADLFPILGKLSSALMATCHTLLQEAAAEMGDLGARGLFTLLRAYTFAPQTISAARATARFPYSDLAEYDQYLTALAEAGYLKPGSNGETGGYHLTSNGRTIAQKYLDAFRSRLNSLEVATTEDVGRLESLLQRITEACIAAPNPPGATFMSEARRIAPSADASALAKIDQYLDELNAFRDDAHIAAFNAHDVSAPAWEAHTLLWRNEVDPATAVALAEKLAGRGHAVDVYAQALNELAAKGWLTESDGIYEVTELGQEIRQQAEILTDRYFYGPWTAVNNAETQELRDLLIKLEANLLQISEPVVA